MRAHQGTNVRKDLCVGPLGAVWFDISMCHLPHGPAIRIQSAISELIIQSPISSSAGLQRVMLRNPPSCPISNQTPRSGLHACELHPRGAQFLITSSLDHCTTIPYDFPYGANVSRNARHATSHCL